MVNILDQIKENKNIPARCYNTATKSDEIFINIATSNGIRITKTTNSVDIYDHIDYTCEYNDKFFTVDIKSSQRTLLFESNYKNIDNEWMWVELKNVNGYTGWLYGDADYVAYVFNEEVWFINRKKLISLVENRVEKVYVNDKSDAHYKLYSRNNRKDLLTLVNFGDIKRELTPYIIH